MSERLIVRLDAEIARAEGIVEREVLKARRAAALARHGLFNEARFALTGLRSQSQRLREPVLYAWVALVDGQIDHCEKLSEAACAKFQRAYELADQAGKAARAAATARSTSAGPPSAIRANASPGFSPASAIARA